MSHPSEGFEEEPVSSCDKTLPKTKAGLGITTDRSVTEILDSKIASIPLKKFKGGQLPSRMIKFLT